MEGSSPILRELLNSVTRLDLDVHMTVEPGRSRPRSDNLVSLLADEGHGSITVKVMKQKGEYVGYKIAKTTPLRLLMVDYCERKGVAYGKVQFGFDGRVVREKQTPGSLGLVDGDVIQAWLDF